MRVPLESWDKFFLRQASLWASRSKDDSTQAGAVLVRNRRLISAGYNGLARGLDDNVPERHERPEKYLWFEHAERNAIYNAAYEGISTKGSSLYVVPMFPCSDCARAIIQAGIVKVYCPYGAMENKRWAENQQKAKAMLEEAGIELIFL